MLHTYHISEKLQLFSFLLVVRSYNACNVKILHITLHQSRSGSSYNACNVKILHIALHQSFLIVDTVHAMLAVAFHWFHSVFLLCHAPFLLQFSSLSVILIASCLFVAHSLCLANLYECAHHTQSNIVLLSLSHSFLLLSLSSHASSRYTLLAIISTHEHRQ